MLTRIRTYALAAVIALAVLAAAGAPGAGGPQTAAAPSPASVSPVALSPAATTSANGAGNIISTPDATGDVGWHTSLALSGADNPVVGYFDSTKGDLKVLRCGNPTCTSYNIIATPDSEGDVGRYTDLVLDGNGNPVLSYQDSTNKVLKVLHCGNPTCTASNIVTTPDPDSPGLYSSIAIDALGNPVVAYQADNNLRVLHCGNPTCTANNSIAAPDSSGAVVRDISIALDSQGRPVVSYYDYSGGRLLKVLRCGDADCMAGNTIAEADSGGTGYTSLVLDGADNPVVSYAKDGISILSCGDRTCSAGNTISNPDATPNVDCCTSIALDATGKPVVAYYQSGYAGLRLLRCGDSLCTSGNSIAGPDSGQFVGLFSSLALDSAGNPAITYIDADNGDLKIVRCADLTCALGNRIATPVEEPFSNHPSIALGPSELPIISYQTTGNGLAVLYCGNVTCTVIDKIATVDQAQGFDIGRDSSIALDADGHPVMSYLYTDHSSAGGELRVAHCGDINCTAGNTISIPDAIGGNVGFSTSLALDAAGNPVVSYYDDSDRDLKILHCGDPTCTAGNSVAAPETDANVGKFSSLVLDGAGNPVVSYYAGSNADLRLLRCNDPNCEGGDETIVAPDTTGEVGAFTSLVLDPTGNPVISYYGATPSGHLKVLHCGNPNCTAENTIAIVDAVANVGLYTSLVLSLAGNPVVSYYDLTNRGLKVAHCGNPACTGGNSVAAPDTAGRVGEVGTSLVLNGSGVPVVAYSGDSQGLKVLHCGDPTCGPNKVVCADQDGDKLCDDEDEDDDSDGCPDRAEKGFNENFGGLRDPFYFWDFFDVWTHPLGQPTLWSRDKVINMSGDIFGVARRFGPGVAPPTEEAALTSALTPPVSDTGYHVAFDRGPIIGPNNWDRAPADGTINIPDDILGVANQFGHSCL